LIAGKSAGSSHLHKIARELGTTAAYLVGETDDPDENALPVPSATDVAEQLDAVRVPHLSLHYSMGGGSVIHEPTVLGYFTVPKEWLRGHIRGTPEDVAVIMGEGDSMEPTIRDGDMLLIDRAQRTLRQNDQIWAIAMHDTGSVKRLRRARSGGYEIHSDNPQVPVDHADDGEMTIVGRMIGVLNWK
jgi:phage repressor protein C with HTH and peptisase S24 domain